MLQCTSIIATNIQANGHLEMLCIVWRLISQCQMKIKMKGWQLANCWQSLRFQLHERSVCWETSFLENIVQVEEKTGGVTATTSPETLARIEEELARVTGKYLPTMWPPSVLTTVYMSGECKSSF